MTEANVLNTTGLHIVVAGNVLAPTRLQLKRGTWRKVA